MNIQAGQPCITNGLRPTCYAMQVPSFTADNAYCRAELAQR